jgi:hypothetical protein
MKRILAFISELLRRKVIRLLGAYVVILWLLAQGFADLFPAFGFPDWSLRAFIISGLAVIPILALLSWKYDLAPPRLVRDPGDVANYNPGLKKAMLRHDNSDAGFVILTWSAEDDTPIEKRFFKAVSIGRGLDNNVDFADERVSRHHAVLWAEDGSWHVRDLDSANGTFIDQAPVTGSAVLPDSCELRFHANGPKLGVHIDKPAATKVT